MAHTSQTQTQGRRLGIRMGSQDRRDLEKASRGPVQFFWESFVALGSSGSWSKRPCWRAKLNNHSFLKYAEAAPSGEVIGIGYSICPSSMWLNWKCMELRVWFFFVVFFWWKSTAALLFYHLTFIVGSWGNKWLPEECTRRDCVAVAGVPTFTRISLEDLGCSISHQS